MPYHGSDSTIPTQGSSESPQYPWLSRQRMLRFTRENVVITTAPVGLRGRLTNPVVRGQVEDLHRML